MNRKIIIIGIILIIITGYYGLQYISSAVHYNCKILKDDCVPPINLTSELIYRVMVQPPWLDQFNIDPIVYFFKDGQYSFWEGNIDGKIIVIRVEKDDSPVMHWITQGLPLGRAINPANRENIKQWLIDHPEYELSE